MASNIQEAYFDQLFHEMYIPLAQYAKCVLHDNALAEDAVQEAFRIATEKAENVMSSQKPKGWLVKTLKHVLFNMNRSQARYRKRIITIDSVDNSVIREYNEEDELLTDMMYSGLVNDKDYELLKLIIFREYTIKEAAEEFGISPEACKKRVQRAKRKLAERITEFEYWSK